MTTSGKPTMAQMARELDLTQATISLALRNHPRISTATRERVKAHAEKVGYRPDPLVSALMAQRRSKSGKALGGTLGVVSFWPASHADRSFQNYAYYSANWEGIRARATELGYGIDGFECEDGPEQAHKLLKTLRARGIQGLILAPSHISVERVPFPLNDFCAACIGRTLQVPALSQVVRNHFAEVSLVCRTLLAEGLRRIGLFQRRIDFDVDQGRRLGGYTAAMVDVPARQRIPPLWITDVFDMRPVAAWIDKHKPEAVISGRGDMLILLRELYPKLRLLSLDLMDPHSMEGIIPARREIGSAVVDMLVAQLHRGERGPPAIPKAVQIMGRWVGREELSPPPPPC